MDELAKRVVSRAKVSEGNQNRAEKILESATIYDGNGCQQISIVQHISSPWVTEDGAHFSYVFRTHANHFGAGVSTETTIDSPKTAEWLADAFRRTAEVMFKNKSNYSMSDYDPDVHYQDGRKIEGVSYARSMARFQGLKDLVGASMSQRVAARHLREGK
mgnify:CR=1 FL=1